MSTLIDSTDAKSHMGQAELSRAMKLLAELETGNQQPAASKTKHLNLDAKIRPTDLKGKQPSLRKRAARGLARVLIIFSTGVASTLAWQSYGDTLRARIASSYPQLGWLAPQTAAQVQTWSSPQPRCPPLLPIIRSN